MEHQFTPERTHIKDLVLVYKEDDPQFFARVEDISEDVKPGWFHLKLLVLTVPVHEVTWILKDIYIDGTEFSMNGNKMRIEKVVSPVKEEPVELDIEEDKKDEEPKDAKVISFSSFKK